MAMLSNPALGERGILLDAPSKTVKQGFRDTLMSSIVGKFQQTGVIPPPFYTSPPIPDSTAVPDLAGLLTLQRDAQDRWMALPNEIRAMVGDPSKLELWLRDPRNKDLAVRFGLYKVREQPKPQVSDAPGGPPKGGAEPGSAAAAVPGK